MPQNDTPKEKPMIIDSTHYAHIIGPESGNSTYNKLVDAKNVLTDADALSASVYNQAQLDRANTQKKGQ